LLYHAVEAAATAAADVGNCLEMFRNVDAGKRRRNRRKGDG